MKQNAALNTAVFNKEQDARRHGALITNRPKLQTLKKQRSLWLKNQQIAIKDEKERSKNENNVDFDLEMSSKILAEKAKKYDQLMTGKQKNINSQCLVDFGLKGIKIDKSDSHFDQKIAKLRHKQIIVPEQINTNDQFCFCFASYPCTKRRKEKT